MPKEWKRKWSRERIIAEMQNWNSRYGEPPRVKEFEMHPDMPNAAVVRYWFGTWGNALKEAGLGNRGRGCSSHRVPFIHSDRGKFVAYKDHHRYPR